MRHRPHAILSLAAALAAAPAAAQVEAIANAKQDLELAFTIDGRIAHLLVEPGDHVKAGDPLIRLDDEESRVRLELLQLRADSDLEIQAAEAEWEMALNDEARIKDAHSKGAAAIFEVERAGLEVKRDFLALELFRQRRLEAEQQLRQAQVQHDLYTITAPTDAVVEIITAEIGESVERQQPVIRIVRADPLVIDAPVPTAQTLRLNVGDPAWVRFNLPDHEQPIEGRIVQLAAVADAASETRRVRIEAPNADNLPAGVSVLVWFTVPDAVTAQTARGR